jgi:hypothetical protein
MFGRHGRATTGAALLMATLHVSSAAGFDTFWHSAATGAVGREFGFSEHATNILQFANFGGPDFFGPLYDTAGGEIVERWSKDSPMFAKMNTFLGFRTENLNVRKMAIFMHFDNLNGKLDTNLKFDYLFLRLLANTQRTLDAFNRRTDLSEGHRKIAILSTLGASLHMVQDFYSHSDWTHNDFDRLGVPLGKTSWGKMRAPTWFEVRATLGRPDKWPFQVRSGMYPPPAGAPNTHSHMNHDNSQLVYKEDETPGKPKNSQVRYHMAGPFPASDANAKEHQLFAVNSGAGASIEWVRLVTQHPGARAAIDAVRTWDVKAFNPAMLHDMEGALASSLLMSCAAYKWDGFNPAPARVAECKGILGVAPAAQALGASMPGFSGIIPTPYNAFWYVQVKLSPVDQLTREFGSQTGDYFFNFPTLAANMPTGITY